MKAIFVTQTGGDEQLKFVERPKPELQAGEVVVKNEYIGINYIDIYIRSGVYPRELPYIPGFEASGSIIAKANDVKNIEIGDRVAYTDGGSGTYAEYTAIKAERVVKVPEKIDSKIPAACMLQGLTAQYLTESTFPLQQGQTALIHAAAGGVGLLLIQMAKMHGVNVIGTVSTETKAKLAKAVGADHTILYTQEDFVAATKKITNGHGVDVIYDSVGKDTFLANFGCLKLRGMLVNFGQASGVVPPIETSILSAGSYYLTRPKLFDYIVTSQELRDRSAKLFDLIISGRLKISIGQEYPLAEAATAHHDLESRKTTAKLVLKV